MRLSGMQGPGLWSPGVTGESGRWLEEPGLWLQVARSKARAELRAHGPRRQAPWRTPRRPRRSCATAGLASAVVAIGSGRSPVACRDQDRVSRAWREVSDHTHGGSRLLLAGQLWPRGGGTHIWSCLSAGSFCPTPSGTFKVPGVSSLQGVPSMTGAGPKASFSDHRKVTIFLGLSLPIRAPVTPSPG